MSIFSDSLKHYIEKNNIRVLPLARYCDIERSTVYKFITGKRLPHSLELVEKMAQFMRLSPLETEKLKMHGKSYLLDQIFIIPEKV